MSKPRQHSTLNSQTNSCSTVLSLNAFLQLDTITMELNAELILTLFSGVFFFNHVLSCDDVCSTEGRNYSPMGDVPERMELFQYHPVKVSLNYLVMLINSSALV